MKRFGFQFYRQADNSHAICFHPEKSRYTKLLIHPGDEPEDIIRAILRQAAIIPVEFLRVR
jgi:predicted RNA binding protein YcfA (HicA-like mRNA interferase family)